MMSGGDGPVGLQITRGASNGKAGLANDIANKAKSRRPGGYIGVVIQPQIHEES